MKKLCFLLSSLVLLIACSTMDYQKPAMSYQETVSKWNSYQDVGEWLDRHFYFDYGRQQDIQTRLRREGPSGLVVRNHRRFFKNSSGYCADAANFAIKALNEINPRYNARWVFVLNLRGQPHHWVTAFTHDGKLYIMDYGASQHWIKMRGIHGPYDSLSEYLGFLESLSIPGFEAGSVYYRDMPGQED